jgi:hypothetical protein
MGIIMCDKDITEIVEKSEEQCEEENNGILGAIDELIDTVGSDEIVVSYNDEDWTLYALKDHFEELEEELFSNYTITEDGICVVKEDEDGEMTTEQVIKVLTE